MDPAPPPPRQWFPRANLSPALKPVGSDDEQRVHAVGDGSRALDGQATSPEGIQSIDLSFHTVFFASNRRIPRLEYAVGRVGSRLNGLAIH
jgi:hypothetical protein